MKFSVIIPTFNEEHTIEQSVLQWLDFQESSEIIISDGLSTDKTIEITKKLGAKIIQPNSPQKSIAEGRNLGATIAENEWLIFLDSDVRFSNISRFIEKIEERISEFDAATIRIKIYPQDEKLRDKIFHFLIYFSLRILFFVGSAGGRGECQIIKKSVFEKLGGYNKSFVGGEDYDLMRRARKQGFRVRFWHDLVGYESPRHYRKSGYLKILFLWFSNWISTILFNRSVSQKWEKVR
ncbi:MAG: glycosyltransferase [Candidatus Marinimicrobia bacterium]|nr:glycosyltransferase [Candidatus Neomarinimicrobiota bacterium]